MQSSRTLGRRSFLGHMAGSLLCFAGVPGAANAVRLPILPGADDDEKLWRLVRQAFPLTPKRIYFNSGGLGPSPYQVLEAIARKQMELETISETGHHVLDEVRKKLAAFVGCDADEVAFTRNATEGMNFVARGVPLRPGDEVITTTHEHPGGAMPWLAAVRDAGAKLILIEPEITEPEKMRALVQRHITPRTRVLMLSYIPCTNGNIFDVKGLCALAREHGIVSVLDGAQVVGQIRIDLHDIGCDFFVTSGHKWLLGPKGTGFIYIAKSARSFYRPSFVGAYSDSGYDLNSLTLQLRKDAIVTEYGTRDAPKIAGVEAAIDFMNTIGMHRVEKRVKALAARLKRHIDDIPGAKYLTPANPALSAGIVTFKVDRVVSTEVSKKMAQIYKIRVRNIHENNINATRISLHIFNSENEVDALALAIAELAKGDGK